LVLLPDTCNVRIAICSSTKEKIIFQKVKVNIIHKLILKIMDFPGILKVIKIQHPELSHKEAQKLASERLKLFKAAQVEGESMAPPPSAPGVPLSPVAVAPVAASYLSKVEERIRKIGTNINTIIELSREAIPEGELVNYGKNGVNSLVTWEDKAGNRLPVSGYFVVWI
jgi:hypothetical protein